MFSDRRGDLTGIDRMAAMLGSEELLRNLGAQPRPHCRGDRTVSQLSGCLVLHGYPLSHIDREGAGLAGVNLERCAKLSRCLDVCVGQASGLQLLQPVCGEWMHARAEQSLHLLRGHRIPGAQAVDAGHARSHEPGLSPCSV